jgi:hypothetical protein
LLLSCTGVCVASWVALLKTWETSLLATDGAAATLVEELITEVDSSAEVLFDVSEEVLALFA